MLLQPLALLLLLELLLPLLPLLLWLPLAELLRLVGRDQASVAGAAISERLAVLLLLAVAAAAAAAATRGEAVATCGGVAAK